jgi:tripartite-type tricarboxylate transporter receptor subunit TctC
MSVGMDFRRRAWLGWLAGAAPLSAGAHGLGSRELGASADARVASRVERTRLVVPSTAGSVSYKLAHALVAAWPGAAGHPLLPIERAGATGALAVRDVAHGPADGSVLLLGNTGTQVVGPEVAPASRARAWLQPLAKLASAPGVLVGHASLPADTLAGVLAWAAARPGQLSYASGGIGSLGHLVMASLCLQAGTALLHVPYKSSAESAADLLAGRVQLNIVSVGAALPLLRSGRVKALAFAGTVPSSHLPHVPTFQACGFAGAEIESWQALFMHPDVPPAVRRALEAVVEAVIRQPDFRQALEAECLDIAPAGGGAAFLRLLQAQQRQVRGLVDRLQLRTA